jgi:hypothetical protein
MNWRKFRRSPKEIRFRLRQEFLNLAYLYASAKGPGLPATPLRFLPPPDSIAGRLRNSPFAASLADLARRIGAGDVPLLGFAIQAAHPMPWRKDSLSGIESGLAYFRRIPYLDAAQSGDHKVVWELNRHQHLVVLAQQHLLSGDPEPLAVLETQLSDWIENNPFQRGINWASALEVAFRSLSWIWIYHLVGDRLKASLRTQMGECLYRHGLHLSANLSIYFSPNTHLLGEAVALDALGRLFDNPAWRQQGGDLVDAQLLTQVLADGAHFEQSTYYHVYAVDFFIFHALLAGKSAEYKAVLLRMGEYLEAVLGTSGAVPLIGDDDGGRLFHPYSRPVCHGRATLSTLGLLYGVPRWVSADSVFEQAAWWLADYRVPSGAAVAPSKIQLFPDTGKAILNAAPLKLILDAAPFGPFQAGHSHAGCLSVLLDWADEEVLIDPGTFVYVGDASRRDWFRSMEAHNTITVSGLPPAVPNGPFGWLGRPETSITQSGAASFALHARYSGLSHCRNVSVHSRGMEIEDVLECPPGTRQAVLSWQCGAAVTEEPQGWWRVGRGVRIHLPGATVQPSFRSTAYGKLEASVALQLRIEVKGSARLATRFEWPEIEDFPATSRG